MSALQELQEFQNPPIRVQYNELRNGKLRCRCCPQPKWLGDVTPDTVHFYCERGRTHYFVEQPTRAVLARDALSALQEAIASVTALIPIIESLPQ